MRHRTQTDNKERSVKQRSSGFSTKRCRQGADGFLNSFLVLCGHYIRTASAYYCPGFWQAFDNDLFRVTEILYEMLTTFWTTGYYWQLLPTTTPEVLLAYTITNGPTSDWHSFCTGLYRLLLMATLERFGNSLEDIEEGGEGRKLWGRRPRLEPLRHLPRYGPRFWIVSFVFWWACASPPENGASPFLRFLPWRRRVIFRNKISESSFCFFFPRELRSRQACVPNQLARDQNSWWRWKKVERGWQMAA